jgi:hypothetical protein
MQDRPPKKAALNLSGSPRPRLFCGTRRIVETNKHHSTTGKYRIARQESWDKLKARVTQMKIRWDEKRQEYVAGEMGK